MSRTPAEPPQKPLSTSALLLDVRRRWLPSEDDRRGRLLHQLCNLLDEPDGGPGVQTQQRQHAEALLDLTQAYVRDTGARQRSLDAFRRDLVELRSRVWRRFVDGPLPPTEASPVVLDLDPRLRDALDAVALAHSVSRERLLGVLFRGIAEGLCRPDAWERPHVEALLLTPLEHGAGGPW